jgi:hypothetical protein
MSRLGFSLENYILKTEKVAPKGQLPVILAARGFKMVQW